MGSEGFDFIVCHLVMGLMTGLFIEDVEREGNE